MTWEEKLAAIQALSGSDDHLSMREPGKWVCHSRGIEIADGRMLSGPGAHGATPQEAVEKTWAEITSIGVSKALVSSRDTTRRYYRWNGFMWAEVGKPCAT